MPQSIDMAFFLFLPVSSHAISICEKMIDELRVEKSFAAHRAGLGRLGESCCFGRFRINLQKKASPFPDYTMYSRIYLKVFQNSVFQPL